MAKKIKVISLRNHSRRMPIHGTVTAWLALKVFGAPEWVWGATGVLFLILWILFIYRCVKEDEEFIDVFTGDRVDVYGNKLGVPKMDNPPVPPTRKTAEERLKEDIKQNGLA